MQQFTRSPAQKDLIFFFYFLGTKEKRKLEYGNDDMQFFEFISQFCM